MATKGEITAKFAADTGEYTNSIKQAITVQTNQLDKAQANLDQFSKANTSVLNTTIDQNGALIKQYDKLNEAEKDAFNQYSMLAKKRVSANKALINSQKQLAKTQTVSQSLSSGKGRTNAAITNVSYQLQDIAVQAEMGTDKMRILAQQGPQLLGALGPLGAIAGVFVGIGAALAPLALQMWDVQDATDKLATANKVLQSVMNDTTDSTKGLNEELIKQYKLGDQLATVELAIASRQSKEKIEATAQALNSLTRDLESYLKTGQTENNVNFLDEEASYYDAQFAAQKYAKSIGMTVDQLTELEKAYSTSGKEGVAQFYTTMAASNQLSKTTEKHAQDFLKAQKEKNNALEEQKRIEGVRSGTDTGENFKKTTEDQKNALAELQKSIDENRRSDTEKIQNKLIEDDAILRESLDKKLISQEEYDDSYLSLREKAEADIEEVEERAQAKRLASKAKSDAAARKRKSELEKAAAEKLAAELLILNTNLAEAQNRLSNAQLTESLEDDLVAQRAAYDAQMEIELAKVKDTENSEREIAAIREKYRIKDLAAEKKKNETAEKQRQEQYQREEEYRELMGNLALMSASSQTEQQEVLRKQQEAKVNQAYIEGTIGFQEFQDGMTQIQQYHDELRIMNTLGGLDAIGEAFGVSFNLQKNFELASALLAEGSATMDAYAKGAETGGVWGGIAAAAASGIQTAAIMAQMYSVNFSQAHGGLDEVPAGMDNSTFLLKAGERVVQPKANSDLTNFLDQQKSGGSGSGGGSTINAPMTINGSVTDEAWFSQQLVKHRQTINLATQKAQKERPRSTRK